MNNQKIKIRPYIKVDREFLELIPKSKEAYSKREAYLDLLSIALHSKARTKKINGVVVRLEPNEIALPLRAWAERWNWLDSRRSPDGKKVKRFLVWLQARGVLTVRMHKKINYTIIKCATHFATETPQDTSESATPNATTSEKSATEKGVDNQSVKGVNATTSEKSATPNATTSEKSATHFATPNATLYIMFYYEEYKGLSIIPTTNAREERFEKIPYERQIIALLSFFGSEIGQNSLQVAADECKINFPPSTKDLVKQVEMWAMRKHSNYPQILAAFEDKESRCWADFRLNWMKYLEKDWQEKPKRGRNGSKKPSHRVFVEADYKKGLAHNQKLFEGL